MAKVLVTESYLEDIADSIRAKNGSSDTYTPAEMAIAIADIPSGGGSDEVYVFCELVPYTNTNVSLNNNWVPPRVAYNVPSNAQVVLYSYSDYVLDSLVGETSGEAVSYVTHQRGQYSFTMPNESVSATFYYDD